MRPPPSGLLPLLICLLFAGGPVQAQQVGVKVAFLAIENLTGDPRYDYLSGITQGVF